MRLTRGFKYFIFLLNGFWAIPLLLGIRLLRPIMLIRIGSIIYDRIGEFVPAVGQLAAEKKVSKTEKIIDVFYFPRDQKCANSYWKQITIRWLTVSSAFESIARWNKLFPRGARHILDLTGSSQRGRDNRGYLEEAQLQLPTTIEEEIYGLEWMAQFGWQKGNPFVCLIVRDSKYLDTTFPGYNWNYHSYRDSNIATYKKAIEYLTSQGIFVFRMGREVSTQLEIQNPKFIDYANRSDKSDFLDVWLFARCKLCVTTGTGPDMISDVFRRPILAVNFLPLNHLWTWSNAIHFPKILRWSETGKMLNLTEYLDNSFLGTEFYARKGITITDLDENQILNCTKEFVDRANGIYEESQFEVELNREFWKIVRAHPAIAGYSPYIHPQSRLAHSFYAYAGESFLR